MKKMRTARTALTLRPALDDGYRARLIERIRQESPPLPSKIDRRIPRDLETIVLKAIVKEPGGRYGTAEALAEDLRRFLAEPGDPPVEYVEPPYPFPLLYPETGKTAKLP